MKHFPAERGAQHGQTRSNADTHMLENCTPGFYSIEVRLASIQDQEKLF